MRSPSPAPFLSLFFLGPRQPVRPSPAKGTFSGGVSPAGETCPAPGLPRTAALRSTPTAGQGPPLLPASRSPKTRAPVRLLLDAPGRPPLGAFGGICPLSLSLHPLEERHAPKGGGHPQPPRTRRTFSPVHSILLILSPVLSFSPPFSLNAAEWTGNSRRRERAEAFFPAVPLL